MENYSCPNSPRLILQCSEDNEKLQILDSTDFEEDYKKNVFLPYIEKLFKVTSSTESLRKIRTRNTLHFQAKLPRSIVVTSSVTCPSSSAKDCSLYLKPANRK